MLFGALGDLSKSKLLPGLFHLDRAGLMPAGLTPEKIVDFGFVPKS